MKYIIDDEQLQALTKGEACSLTKVPELPVKPWRERLINPSYARDIDIDAEKNAEITELRALCQAQAVVIEEKQRDHLPLSASPKPQQADVALDAQMTMIALGLLISGNYQLPDNAKQIAEQAGPLAESVLDSDDDIAEIVLSSVEKYITQFAAMGQRETP